MTPGEKYTMPVLFGTYSWNFDSWFYSEKQYLPHITELYEKYGDYLVDPKPQLPAIAAILQDLSDREKALFVNGNTHFEGSVPTYY